MTKLQLLTVFVALLTYACADKPFYASSQPYPGVLPQNMPSTSSSTTTSTTSTNLEIDNRFGGNSPSSTDLSNGPEKDLEIREQMQLLQAQIDQLLESLRILEQRQKLQQLQHQQMQLQQQQMQQQQQNRQTLRPQRRPQSSV